MRWWTVASMAVSLVFGCFVAGCGNSANPQANSALAPGKASPSAVSTSDPPQAAAPRSPAPDTGTPAEHEQSEPAAQDRAETEKPRSLADLLEVPDAASAWMPELPRMAVDEARAEAAGIRKLSGRRLTLFTDLEPDGEVDFLPEAFDQAFTQWCEYFGIDPAEHSDWRATGFLMKDRDRFARAGLIPKALPPFEHGFSWNYDLWLNQQPSPYYRRHLLLHEGTHSFMNTVLGSCGPPWYMEGIAELLATHHWQDGRLTLNHIPTSREEVPMWGRIKIVQDAFAARRAQRLKSVLQYSPSAFLETEPYGWCWSAATLLDRHPRYQQRFRQLGKLVMEHDLTDRFRRLIGDDWDALADQWQVFVANLEYGHDVPATAIDFTPGKPLPEAGAGVSVDAARGWQNSGLRLEAGKPYQLSASGRYQVASEPQIWWCEPGGVSIRYYKGRPLGILLAAVRVDPSLREGSCALIRPVTVGSGNTLEPDQTGTLFLRINDSAAELDDNAGSLTVQIDPKPSAD